MNIDNEDWQMIRSIEPNAPPRKQEPMFDFRRIRGFLDTQNTAILLQIFEPLGFIPQISLRRTGPSVCWFTTFDATAAKLVDLALSSIATCGGDFKVDNYTLLGFLLCPTFLFMARQYDRLLRLRALTRTTLRYTVHETEHCRRWFIYAELANEMGICAFTDLCQYAKRTCDSYDVVLVLGHDVSRLMQHNRFGTFLQQAWTCEYDLKMCRSIMARQDGLPCPSGAILDAVLNTCNDTLARRLIHHYEVEVGAVVAHKEKQLVRFLAINALWQRRQVVVQSFNDEVLASTVASETWLRLDDNTRLNQASCDDMVRMRRCFARIVAGYACPLAAVVHSDIEMYAILSFVLPDFVFRVLGGYYNTIRIVHLCRTR